METNTSTEGNGNKKLKVTRTDKIKERLDEYFARFVEEYDKYPDLSRKGHYEEDIEYFLSTHFINFQAKEESVKVQVGEENENGGDFASSIDVVVSGRKDIIVRSNEELAQGLGTNTKSADKEIVKQKVEKIRKQDIEKKLKREAEEKKKSEQKQNEER